MILIIKEISNKPGTAQVGAISKAQKTKGLQSVKYSLLQYPCEEKMKKIRFFQTFWSTVSRIVPKNVEGDLKKPN